MDDPFDSILVTVSHTESRPELNGPNIRLAVGRVELFSNDDWSREWVLICMVCFSSVTMLRHMDVRLEDNLIANDAKCYRLYADYRLVYSDL